MTGHRHSQRKQGRPLPLLGAHVSTAGGLTEIITRARRLGAESVQIFASNPRQWHHRDYPPEETARFAAQLSRAGLRLFIHTSYLLNLASPDPELRSRSASSLAQTLRFGTAAGAAAVVTHVGSHRGEGFRAAVPLVAAAVNEARIQAADRHTPLLLETSAGGGHSVGSTPEELRVLVDALEDGITGVCLDTAHLFAAGYPIHTGPGLAQFISRLDALELLAKVRLVHFNDSVTEFGSHHDRHANLWEGRLGRAGLMVILSHPTFQHVPFVLEVPGFDGHGPDVRNMRRARLMRRALAAAGPVGPAASGSLPQATYEAAET